MSDLLQHLREAGEVDSKGYFTLDARRAREKMQQFLLADNHQFTLNLVAAGVALKSSAISLDASQGRLDVTMRDVTLPREFLEQPFSGLFIANDRTDLEGYRELSIGLNAALALKPKQLEVRSGSLMVDVAAEPPQVQELTEAVEGTRVTFLEKTLTALLSHLLWQPSLVPELVCVEQRAGWGAPPVSINGKKLSRSGDHVGLTTFSGAVCNGMIWGSDPSDEESTVHVIKNGVLLTTRRVKLPPPQASVIVHARQVLKNVSGTDLVLDERWMAVLEDVSRHGCEALLQRLCEEFRGHSDNALLRHLLLQAAVSRITLVSWWQETNPKVRWLGSLPLFTLVSGQTVCIAELMDQVRRDHALLYLHNRVPLPPLPPDLSIVGVSEHWELEALRSIFAGAARLAEREVELAMRRQQNLEKSRPREVRLDPTHYLVVVPFQQDGYSGELGLMGGGRLEGLSRITCVRRRRVITVRERAVPLPIEAVVESDAFHANFTFDDLDNDAGLSGAVKVLSEVYFEACRRVAARGESPGLRLAVRRGLEEWVRQRRRRTGLFRELQECPLFPTVSGRLASVADLVRDLEEFGQVAYVENGLVGPQKDHRQLVLETDTPQRPIVRLLRGLFGDRLMDYSKQLAKDRKALQVQQRPREQPTLAGQAISPIEFADGTNLGSVGLSLDEPPLEEGKGPYQIPLSNVRFLKDGHTLVQSRLPLPVGPLEAALESARFTPNETWDEVVEDDAYQAARKALLRAIDPLAETVAGAFPGWPVNRQMQARRLLLDYLAWRGQESCAAAMEVPLFATASHGLLSWRQVRAACPDRWSYLALMPRQLPKAWQDGPPVLIVGQTARSRALRALFADVPGKDAEPALETDLARERFFDQPKAPLKLPRDPCDFWHGPIPGLPGEMALVAPGETVEKGTALIVFHKGRRLDEVLVGTPIPGRALVEAPQVTPLLRYDGVVHDDALRELTARVGQAVVEQLRQLASGPVEPHCDLAHAVLMYAVGEAPNVPAVAHPKPPWDWAAQAPILEDSTGARLSLSDLAAQYTRLQKLPWVAVEVNGAPVDAIRVVRADSVEQALLKWLFKTLVDYRKTLEEDEVIRANRSREPLESLTLPEDRQWLARTAMDGGMEGEIGVAPPGTTPGITFAVERRPVQTVAVFGHLPIVGVVSSPRLDVNRRWDEVKLTSGDRNALEAALDRLFADLAGRGAAPELFFEYLLRRRDRLIEGEKLASAALPLFVSTDGQPRSLEDLLDWYHRDRTFLMAIGPGAVEGNAVRTRGGLDPAFRFLSRFFMHAVRTVNPVAEVVAEPLYALQEELRHVVARGGHQIDALIEQGVKAARKADRHQTEPPKAAPRLAAEPGQAAPRPAAQPRKKARARTAAEEKAGMEMEQVRHVQSLLQQCLTDLAGRNEYHLGNDAVRRVRVVASGDLAWYDALEREIRVSLSQPVVQRLVARLPEDPACIAYLASVVYSVLNRSQENVRDQHEMRFLEALASWLSRPADR
ncbi:MAG: hypothetical protein ACYCW6_08315 [Candidatus Xenobia bacterium]